MMCQTERCSHIGGASFYGTITLSLLAHFLVLSLLIFAPSLLPRPRMTFGPAYAVQLVGMPAADLPDQGSRTAALQDAALKGLKALPTRHPILNRTALDDLPAVPIQSLKIRKRTENSSVEKAIDELRRKIPATNQQHASDAMPDRATFREQAVSSSATHVSDAEIDREMKNYYAVIWGRIRNVWTIPRGLLPPENIEAVVHVAILQDGTITNLGMEKRSGNNYFDESALRAVKKANPLPPLPEVLKDNSLEVGIRFHSSDFQ